MNIRCLLSVTAISLTLPAMAHAANPGVLITEFCSDTSNNEHFEFVEFTNVGTSPVDMTGWSEDDNSATPNKASHILSGFGIMAPGQSAILTEADPAAFRTYWGLSASVKVVGPYSNDNLNTSTDSITLFDATGTLVDRLDYSTTNGGSADSVSRNAPLSALGQNNNTLWQNSFVGDAYGSYGAPQKPTIRGNPGTYPVPEPGTLGFAVAGVFLLMRRQRTTRGPGIT